MYLKFKKMKYKLNDRVFVENSQNFKTIVDLETIIGEPIYYMSDGTSYHEKQIKDYYSESIVYENEVFFNKNFRKKRYDSLKNSISCLVDLIDIEIEKEKEKTKKIELNFLLKKFFTKLGLRHP